MSTVTSEYTRAAQERALKTIRQGQQAVVEGVKVWADAVEKTISGAPKIPYADQLPTPQEILRTSFAFAEQLLEAQREFAEGIVAAAAPVLEKTFSGKAPAA